MNGFRLRDWGAGGGAGRRIHQHRIWPLFFELVQYEREMGHVSTVIRLYNG